MKKILLILLLAGVGFAQSGNTIMLQFAGVPSGTCVWIMLAQNATTGDMYNCTAAGTWQLIGSSGGGNIPVCKTYTVAYSNAAFVAAATTADVTLFALPAKGKLTGMTIKHSAQYTDSGGAMSEVNVSVGDGTSHTAYSAAQNIGEATAVADTTFTDTSQFKSTTMAASNVVAHFTATGRDFGDGAATFLTAGSVAISACWVVLP